MKRSGIVLVFFSLLVFTLPVSHGEAFWWDRNKKNTVDSSKVVVTKDLVYTPPSSSEDHKLDIYAPRGAKGAPVIMYVYGGGWSSGRKWNYGNLGNSFSTRGYVFVVPNYRRSGTAKFPAPMEDIANAFSWIRKNIEKYGGKPAEIFIAGHSAGGHLAVLLALDPKFLRAANVPPGSIKGVMALSAIYDLPRFGMQGMLKSEFGDDKNTWVQASPTTYLRKGLPPFLIVFAQWESGNLKRQARDFAKVLETNGDKVKLLEIKGKGHINEILGETAPVVPPMIDFLNSVLGPKAPKPAVQ